MDLNKAKEIIEWWNKRPDCDELEFSYDISIAVEDAKKIIECTEHDTLEVNGIKITKSGVDYKVYFKFHDVPFGNQNSALQFAARYKLGPTCSGDMINGWLRTNGFYKHPFGDCWYYNSKAKKFPS